MQLSFKIASAIRSPVATVNRRSSKRSLDDEDVQLTYWLFGTHGIDLYFFSVPKFSIFRKRSLNLLALFVKRGEVVSLES